MPTLLWWGRSDTRYSRNQILLKLLKKSGWQINYFYPFSSAVGKAQALFQRPRIPDMIWVPCFRQRDMPSAIYWARKWHCPLVFDPLISAFQKEVFEKNKWPRQHKSAVRLRKWESRLFQNADLIVADTRPHADFYIQTLGADPRKVAVIYVGADEDLFRPRPVDEAVRPIEILFYGSFLQLHGPEVILDAAKACQGEAIKWVLLGNGDSKPELQKRAQDLTNVFFEPWIDYKSLPQRLWQAHIILGIFGTTQKASLVIPNKVFQAMAVGRPLITRQSSAYPQSMRSSPIIGWVPPGDAQALEALVRRWAENPEDLIQRGHQTYRLYQNDLCIDQLSRQLQKAIEMAFASDGFSSGRSETEAFSTSGDDKV